MLIYYYRKSCLVHSFDFCTLCLNKKQAKCFLL